MKMGMEFWTQHVAAAKLQGALASAYAKQHGISVTALYYRRCVWWTSIAQVPGQYLGHRGK